MMQKEAGLKVSKFKEYVLLSEETDDASFKFTLIESFYSTNVVHCFFKCVELDL